MVRTVPYKTYYAFARALPAPSLPFPPLLHRGSAAGEKAAVGRRGATATAFTTWGSSGLGQAKLWPVGDQKGLTGNATIFLCETMTCPMRDVAIARDYGYECNAVPRAPLINCTQVGTIPLVPLGSQGVM